VKNNQPGGLRHRRPDIGGRPKSDINNYGTKKRNDGGKSAYTNKREGFGDRVKRDVQLFSAICTNCKRPCEVPFRPDGSKPVLCRDCFANKTSGSHSNSQDRDYHSKTGSGQRMDGQRHMSQPAPTIDTSELLVKLAIVEKKIDELITLVAARNHTPENIPTEPETNSVIMPAEEPAKKPKKARVTVAKKTTKKTAVKKATKK
jgi:CxxC-x17-CxxC domain-containing protein